jgi:hypothetical protein
MLKPAEAKQALMSNLGILLVLVFWPLFTAVISGILNIIGFESTWMIGLALVLIWLGALVWFIIRLWKLAPELNVSPYASLWLLLPFVGVFFVAMLFLEPLKYISDNKPAAKQLPLTWSLIKESWKLYNTNFKLLIKSAVGFIYLGLILGASAGLASVWTVWSIMHLVISILSIFATMWISIKIFFTAAQLDEGKTPSGNETQLANKNFWRYFIVGLLVIIITIGPFATILVLAGIAATFLAAPMFGGDPTMASNALQSLQDNMVLLVGGGSLFAILFLASWVWMIYKSIQLSQAVPALLLNGQTGMSALRESSRIIKNRWWGMFWKNQLWGYVIGMGYFVLALAMGIIIVIPIILIQFTDYAAPLTEIFDQVLGGALQMVLAPLAFIFMIKLYRAFRKTAE